LLDGLLGRVLDDAMQDGNRVHRLQVHRQEQQRNAVHQRLRLQLGLLRRRRLLQQHLWWLLSAL
jgi:hypothetical protein